MIEIAFCDGTVLRYHYNDEGKIMVEEWLESIGRVFLKPPVSGVANLREASQYWYGHTGVKSIKEY